MKKLAIVGTGGFAKEVFCLISDLGLEKKFECFFEPNFDYSIHSNLKLFERPILPISAIDIDLHIITIAISNSKIREEIVNQLPNNIEYITLIHPNVIHSKFINIGIGSIICAGSILTCNINIGRHSHLNLKTTIGHDCDINDYFTSAPNASISGNCKIGKHVYFGTASMIKQGLSIADYVTIGMGAVVTKNISNSGIFIGNPAKELIK
jgi:sugar O-acyltransferase (sialic acid O-acetyltransferase NeuD family)